MLYVVIHIHVAAMKSIRIPYYHSECHITSLKYRIGFRLSKISCKVIPVLYASFFLVNNGPTCPFRKYKFCCLICSSTFQLIYYIFSMSIFFRSPTPTPRAQQSNSRSRSRSDSRSRSRSRSWSHSRSKSRSRSRSNSGERSKISRSNSRSSRSRSRSRSSGSSRSQSPVNLRTRSDSMERLHKKSKKMKQLKKQLKHQQDEFEAQQQVSNYKKLS